MADKFTLNREKIKSIAEDIRNMEKECDSSMRGAYLATLVGFYAETFGDDFSKMFCYIYDKQKKKNESYGDCDTYVTKLNINEIDVETLSNHEKKYNLVSRGILLKNIFCDVNFIITEVTRTHRDMDISSVSYFAYEYKGKENIKTIDIKQYNRFNYESGIVVYKKEKHFNESFVLDINESPKIFYYYNKFKLLMDSIREPYYELMEKAGEDVSKI